jgi:3-dehydrosphinganine reductase
MRRFRDFKGLNVLVTGGSSGIGLEISRAFIRRGAIVTIMARDPRGLEIAGKNLKRVHTLSADVSDLMQLRKVLEGRGRFDILVNSAGMAHPGRLQDLEPDIIRRTIEVNLLGTINTCSCVVPDMGPGGHVANISSIAGIIGLYGYTAYSASKFGVIGFSEALRMELVQKDIGVTVVLPPDTRTPQLDHEESFKPPETRAISGSIAPRTAEWVAEETLRAIADRRFMAVLTLQGKGVHIAQRMAPGLTRWFVDRKVREAGRTGRPQ